MGNGLITVAEGESDSIIKTSQGSVTTKGDQSTNLPGVLGQMMNPTAIMTETVARIADSISHGTMDPMWSVDADKYPVTSSWERAARPLRKAITGDERDLVRRAVESRRTKKSPPVEAAETEAGDARSTLMKRIKHIRAGGSDEKFRHGKGNPNRQ